MSGRSPFFSEAMLGPHVLSAAPRYSQINHEIQIDDTSLTGGYYKMRTPGYFEMRNAGNFGMRKYGCFEMRNSGNFDANTQHIEKAIFHQVSFGLTLAKTFDRDMP